MVCKKCGFNIEDNSKFCGNCGEKIEELNIDQSTHNLDNINNESQDLNIKSNENSEVSQTSQQNIEQFEEQITNNHNEVVERLETNVTNDNINSNKLTKNSKLILLIVLSILILGTGTLIFLSMNSSSNNSIIVLEKALGNFNRKGKQSGTVNANILVQSKTEGNVDISSTVMYSKNNNIYDLLFRLNKSKLNDEINLYSRINEKEALLYVKSNILDMLGISKSDLDIWLKYSLDLSSESINQNEISNTIDIGKIIDEQHFKFIDKTNGIRKYKLIIDKTLIEKMINSWEDNDKETLEDINSLLEEFGDNVYEIEFYFNDAEELVKIQIDLTNLINDDEISNVLVNLQFINFNNTIVSIPNDALTSTVNLEDYISIYSIQDTNSNDNMDNSDLNIDSSI